MSINKLNQKGFTLVELVIVLAIAALILAGVLLAVGGAQRSQRDTARKAIAGRMATALENYAYNNSGGYPAVNTALSVNYTNGINDPDSGAAPAPSTVAASAATSTSGVKYTTGAICSGGAATTSGANAKNYAITYWSESAGASQCIDNK